MNKPLLVGSAGCGSVIAEFGFNLAGIAYDYEEVDYGEGSATRARLLEVNPLGQVPALVLPGGQTIMTESLAMLHWIQDEAPGAPLIPPKGDAARPRSIAGRCSWSRPCIPRSPMATTRRSGSQATRPPERPCARAPTCAGRSC